ncbi:hypothetical protein [Woodsholea maritima]|uniref:hypothetical protein n=1 Tax=Woodsholea maritima TaxID=240237 RepID=UPI00036CAB65|nr:hypothetical protein [Woodsholea maritima]
MLRTGTTIIAGLASALVLSVSAYAQLPAPLEAAISRTAPAGVRSVAANVEMATSGERIVARVTEYEVGQSEYQLLHPMSEAQLSDVQRELWDELRTDEEEDKDEDSDTLLMSENEMRELIGTRADLVRQDGGLDVYAFRPQSLGDDEDDAAIVAFLHGEIALSGDNVAWMRLYAPESFKPNFLTRINRFDIHYRYEPVDNFNTVRLAGLTQHVVASAMGQNVDTQIEMAFSDVEYADAGR